MMHWRQPGSFIAGLLIGQALVLGAFALTGIGFGAWQLSLAVGALASLVLGVVLHGRSEADARRQRETTHTGREFSHCLPAALRAS